MNKDKFWEIIDNVNSKVKVENRPKIFEETKKTLMKLNKKEIMHWKIIMEEYMHIADRQELWVACAATQSHSSDDGFMDFRAWLISKGKEVYMNALNNPDSLAEVDIPIGNANFEDYLYVAPIAYEMKYSTNNKKVDLYRDMVNEKLSKEVYDDLMAEINLKEDITFNWQDQEYDEVVPNLYKKCHQEQDMKY